MPLSDEKKISIDPSWVVGDSRTKENGKGIL